MKKLLVVLLLLTGVIQAQITSPSPLKVCDQNNDGFESFDLTIKNPEIFGKP
ncbi:MAG: hypothetical protein IPN80_09580 [Flavobacterium sp.]|nr:hypothetical protein [Flavobacterium sp.]